MIPREVREWLALKSGDTLRYRATANGVLLDKAPATEVNDPFAGHPITEPHRFAGTPPARDC